MTSAQELQVMAIQKKEYQGVISYEILPDGCLNGVYSDNHPDTENRIFNEILKKSDESKSIDGNYKALYFDVHGPQECTVKVTPNKKNHGHFYFEWFSGTKRIFDGSGWQLRENQIVVSYRHKPKK